MRALIALLVMTASSAGFAVARQPVEIVDTSPAEGEAGVPLESTITFRLSKPLPPFGSLFTRKFSWSPVPSAKLWALGHDFDDDRRLTIAFFTLEHEIDTDFSFWVYGVRTEDGSLMDRPFTLNYTTAPEHGALSLSGTVAFGERLPPAPSAAVAELADGIRVMLDANTRALERALSGSDRMIAAFTTSGNQDAAPLRSARSQAEDLGRTVVLLLERYQLDGKRWRVRSATVPDASGNFTLQHVRPGTYWPVAINYATEDGEEIGRLGFYDETADFSPDPITVTDDQISGIHLSLFELQPVTASAYADLATHRALDGDPEPVLMEIEAGSVDSAGRSDHWRFTFADAPRARRLVVDVDALSVRLAHGPAPSDFASRQPLPGTFIDSDAALAVAETAGGADFGSAHENVVIGITAGDLAQDVRPAAGSIFWHVEYRTAGSDDRLSVFIDIESGEVLRAAHVSSNESPAVPAAYALHAAYPNPSTDRFTLSFSVPKPSSVRIELFDMLGRAVGIPVEGRFAAGVHQMQIDTCQLSPGLYGYRITAGKDTLTRTVLIVR